MQCNIYFLISAIQHHAILLQIHLSLFFFHAIFTYSSGSRWNIIHRSSASFRICCDLVKKKRSVFKWIPFKASLWPLCYFLCWCFEHVTHVLIHYIWKTKCLLSENYCQNTQHINGTQKKFNLYFSRFWGAISLGHVVVSNLCETGRGITITRAWLMFQVSVVMVLPSGSTTESSMMYAFCAMWAGRNFSAQRGALLVLVRRRLEIRRLSGVTSRKMMSSVKTWLLRNINTDII